MAERNSCEPGENALPSMREGQSGLYDDLLKTPLPRGFLFGVSNSGFQVEGGFNGPGLPLNNWWEWEISGKAESSGRACSFWERPDEHLELAASLGLDAFRMSVEWARLQPATTNGTKSPPAWDEEAIRGYARIVRSIQRKGMQPVITLLHFTHPVWLGADLWLRADAADKFSRYCEVAAESLNKALIEDGGEPVRMWVTLNEPNALAMITYLLGRFPCGVKGVGKMARALDILFASHALAYDRLHDLYLRMGWGRPLVSYNTFCMNLYEADRIFADLLMARARGAEQGRLRSYGKDCRKRWVKRMRLPEGAATRNGMPGRMFEGAVRSLLGLTVTMEDFPATAAVVYSSDRPEKLDYLGLDIYDPLLRDFPKMPSLHEMRTGLSNVNMELWQEIHDPGVFGATVEAWSEGYEDLPVYILENGMCTRRHNGKDYPREDGLTRPAFLRAQLKEVARLLRRGIPLRGYFYWSLTDNYEWGSYEPRFGLYAYDYREGAILPQDCMGEDAGSEYASLVAAWKNADEAGGDKNRCWEAPDDCRF